MDNHTGRKHRPCSKPSTTIPKNILKNILKISDEANAVTTMPRKVLKPGRRDQEIVDQSSLRLPYM
jgi:hypothetical protein